MPFTPAKITRKLLAAAAILGMTLSWAVTSERSADADTIPVVYAAHNDMWDTSVKPGIFAFGNGNAPHFTGLKWKSWGPGSAWATGKLWLQENPRCSPSYKCPESSRWVGVYLNTIRLHAGTRYYARMAVKFWYAGKWHWDVGWFKGGFWTFPLTAPYL